MPNSDENIAQKFANIQRELSVEISPLCKSEQSMKILDHIKFTTLPALERIITEEHEATGHL